MSTLEDVITEIQEETRKSGIPPAVHTMTLYLWLDTNQKTCAPITGTMKVRFNAYACKIYDILRAIDKATPIYKIKRKHLTYHVAKIEEFMNKRCEV